MKWTREKPNKPGYYWCSQIISEYGEITKLHNKMVIYIPEFNPTNICYVPGGSLLLCEISWFMGPLEMPHNPIDNLEEYIINKSKDNGLNPHLLKKSDEIYIWVDYKTGHYADFMIKEDIFSMKKEFALFYSMGNNCFIQFPESDLDEKLNIYIKLYKK